METDSATKHWKLAGHLAVCNTLDVSTLISSNVAWMMIDSLFIAVSFLMSIHYYLPADESSLASNSHRFVLSKIDFIRKFGTVELQVAFYIYAGFKLTLITIGTTYAISAYKFRTKMSGVDSFHKEALASSRLGELKPLLTIFTSMQIIDLTILLVPANLILASAVLKLHWAIKAVSVLLMLTIPGELYLNNFITFDMSFIRMNMLQGRSYTVFSVRVIGFWVLSSFSETINNHPRMELVFFYNISHMLLALILISLMYRMDNNLHKPIYRIAFLLVITFYLVDSMVQTLIVIFDGLGERLDADYTLIVCGPLVYFLLTNISQARARQLFEEGFKIDRLNIESGVFYVEQLYMAFLRQHTSNHKVNLVRSMCEHVARCSNPYCLCFMLKTNYSSEVGALAAKNSRVIFKELSREARSNYRNGFILFNEVQAISDLKENYHREIFDASPGLGGKSVRLSKRDKDNIEEDALYFIDFETEYTFKLVIASLFSSIINRSRVDRLFYVILTTARYLIFEYRNQIAALTLIYGYIANARYKQEATWYRDYLLQMLVGQSKLFWKNSDAEAKAVHIPGLNLSHILDYRLKVHLLRNVIRDLIIEKIDIYNQLSERQIDYKGLMKRAKVVREGILDTSRSIDSLLTTGSRNIKLTREAVVFEICVLEHDYVSAKLRQRYRESLIDMRTRVGSINSTNQKQRFSLYNASNIVVFAKHIDDTFRITRFTHNAVYLFGFSKTDLISAPLTTFMPTIAAVHHDNLVLAYLNGDSKCQSKGKLYLPVIAENGNTRSVMLLPKIELTFFDDVSVAALISVRSKNHWPMIYADKMSNIFSANKRAQKILETHGQAHSSSLFSIFPRLLRVFGKEAIWADSKGELVDTSMKESKAPSNSGYYSPAEKMVHHAKIIEQMVKDLVATVSMELFYFQASKNFSVQQGGGGSDMDVDATPTTMNPAYTETSTKKVKSLGASLGASFSVSMPMLNKSQLISDPSKILKVRMSIESHRYQKGIIFREIALMTVQRTGTGVQQIYKMLSQYNSRYLLDFMMVGPDDLLLFFRAANLMNKLNRMNHTGEISRRDMSYSISKSQNMTQQLETERQQFQIKVQTQEPHYDREDGNEGVDVFNILIKPTQYEDSIYLEDDESASKPYSARDILAAETSNFQCNPLRQVELSKGFSKNLAEIISQLQSDYESEYVKKMIEDLYECMYHKENARKALSPRLIAGAKGGSNKEEFVFQDNVVSAHEMDSISIDKDSHSELKVEYSDPLKTLIKGDQPSTFLRSSSKRSVKETQDATTLRRAINNSHNKLKYKPMLWSMLVFCFVLSVLKLTFKIMYAEQITNVLSYETSVNLMSNLLRPSSFFLKDALKHIIRANLSINTSLLPYGDIVDEGQQDYYILRMQVQLPEIQNYFETNMKTGFTFMAGIKEEQLNIFSLSYLLQNLYIELVMEDREAKKSEIYFPNVVRWREVSQLSQRIFLMMMQSFEEQISKRESNMAYVLKYFIANYMMNVGITVIIFVAMLYIFKSIDRQVRDITQRLLIADKTVITESLKMMAKNVIALGEEDPRERKEFRDEIIIHLRAIDQMGSEGSALSSLRKRRRRRGPPNQKRSNNSFINNLSYFYNTNNKQYFRKLIVLLVLLLCVNLPSFINFNIQQSGYSRLLDMLSTSSAVNLASSSSQFFSAIMFRRLSYLVLGIPFDGAVNNYLYRTREFMQEAKTFKDADIQNLFSTTLVCNISASIMSSDQHDKCIFSSEANQDYTLFRGIYDIVREADELTLIINQGLATSQWVKSYFESEQFLRFDYKTFYQSVGMKIVGFTYTNLIFSTVHTQEQYTNAILAIYFIELIALCLYLTLMYIPRELRVWNEVQDLLLILNDDILNGIQIRTYFKVEF